MICPLVSPLATQVPHVATAKFTGIAVENLRVEPCFRDTHSIMAVGLRRKVAHGDDKLVRIFGTANEGNDAVTIIATVDPLEAFLGKILSVERRLITVERVERRHEMLQLSMRFELQELPFKIAPHIPFAPLSELHAHE